MKRLLLVLALGLAAGLGAHTAWFELRRPPALDEPAAELHWLRTDLQLTPAQFARVEAIHAKSGPQLHALATQAARMRAELAEFERRRVEAGRIDFLAFARFVERRRIVDHACEESTRRLVAASASEMTPDQRRRYFQLLEPRLPHATVALE